MIPFSEISKAREFLRQHLPVTRLVSAPSLSRITGANVFLKLETDQPTGSFKPRGALYGLWARLARGRVDEVIACSTGNHGAAVAYAAKVLGVQARIFLPSNPNPVKRAKIVDLGAEVSEGGGEDLAAVFHEASEYARTGNIYFLNDATDQHLPAGPATIACEIHEQHPAVDTIYVPMGDTALIRGVASAAKHLSLKIRVVGVQAERAPSYYLSWKKGEAVTTDTCDTIADGLSTRTPDEGNVSAIRELVDDVHLVSDDQMLHAIRHLLLEEHVLAEPAGAAATAALLQSGQQPGKNIVALVTGANIVPAILRRAVCERLDENPRPA